MSEGIECSGYALVVEVPGQDGAAAHWMPLAIDGRFCLLSADDVQALAERVGCVVSLSPQGVRRSQDWVVAGNTATGPEVSTIASQREPSVPRPPQLQKASINNKDCGDDVQGRWSRVASSVCGAREHQWWWIIVSR